MIELTNDFKPTRFLEKNSATFFTDKVIKPVFPKLNKITYPKFIIGASSIFPERIVDNSYTLGIANYDIIDELKVNYELSNEEDIINFISENMFLMKILSEAPKNIYKVFGRNIKLKLELETDPEEGWQEIFIVIKSPYSPKEAFDLEKKLFNEWFVDVMDKVGNKLNFIEEPL